MAARAAITVLFARHVFSLQDMMFKKTTNMTSSSWASFMTKELGTASFLMCAAQCLKERDNCNSWNFDKTQQVCQLGNVDYLEESDGTPTVEILIDVEAVDTVDMLCRGGYNCCSRTRRCEEKEGDCRRDDECQTGHVCTSGSCTSAFSLTGGLWDSSDSCCEIRCTEDHPCEEGLGKCLTTSDCYNSTWSICSTCLSSTNFPSSLYPDIASEGYTSTDLCCRRICISTAPCDYKEIGCAEDEDCVAGLGCGMLNDQPTCQDIDECAQDPDICSESLGTVCLNLVSTYRCIDPEEDRVALVIGGSGLKSIEVYTTYDVKGENPGGSATVFRNASSCSSHTIPDMPVSMWGANAAYMGGTLYVCGGRIDEEGRSSSGSCYSLNVMQDGSSWVKSSSMRHGRREHRMVAYGDAMFAAGGWTENNDAHASTEWFQAGSWSEKSWYYGDWAISVSCLAADPESGIIYQVGGYSPSHSDFYKYLYQVLTYSPSTNSWQNWQAMYYTLGRERHACGIMKKIEDDNKILFYTGGTKIKYTGSDYTGSSSYDAYYYDLTASTGWHSFTGATGQMNMEFVRTSPYEGYIFNWSPTLSLTNWYVWDEYAFKFQRNENERLSLRQEFTVAGIPKSSPFLTKCFK